MKISLIICDDGNDTALLETTALLGEPGVASFRADAAAGRIVVLPPQ